MDGSSFAKELAQALREAEDAPVAVNKEQLIHDTYQKLCHDDPSVGITSCGCTALHTALVDSTSSYALCNRLVNGIRHCCHRYTTTGTATGQKSKVEATPTTNASDPPRDTATVDDRMDEENGDGVPHDPLFPIDDMSSSLAGAYAQLAWAVHVTIPLECCRTTDRLQAASYLGSFVASDVASTESQPIEHDVPIRDLAERISAMNVDEGQLATNGHDAAVTNGAAHNGENGDHEDDSLAEVFATQSDSSDYEFDSGYQVEASLEALNEWALSVEQSFDPLHLSKALPTTSWDDTVQAVSELVSSLTHSQITTLTWMQYQKMRGADQLTQLCLALLVPSSSLHSPVLTSATFTTDHWQRLGTHVVQIFRDCTLQYVSTEPDALDDLLRLVRILLQVDQNNASTISPATWVGLSSLSALCMDIRTSKDKTLLTPPTLRILQTFIVDVAGDLAELLEKSSRTSVDDVAALYWSCLSLFQVLALSVVGSVHGQASIPNNHSQVLLNSGLFRQWLLYWSQTEDADYKILVQGTLLDLCFGSPSLLGKYAWRFPELAAMVTATDCTKDSSINQSHLLKMLWNLFGIHLLKAESGGSSAPKVQWKNKPVASNSTSSPRIVSLESCQEMAWSLFATMCTRASEILTDWKLRRQHKLPSSSSSSAQAESRTKLLEQVDVLNEWDRLALRLSSPMIRSLFLEHMIPPGTVITAEAKIRHELQPIQHILSQWPSVDQSLTRKPDIKDVKVVGDMTHPAAMYPLEEEEAVRSVRKAVKTILSVLESTTADSATQQRYSSKAD